ncbi:MAG: cobalamin-dependent protein, partial [Bacillales bacterium]
MKIVCTTLNAKYIHTNLAIRYLKAYARPQFDIDIVEYTIKDPVLNIVTDLIKRNPDVVGFSCYIWNIEDSIKIIKLIKKINPSVQTVFGGPEVSYDAPDWLERIPELDFIISGEGEKAFKDLLYAFNGEKSLREVGGLAYRENGEIRFNPQTEKLDLSAMPSPFRFEEDLPHLPKRITYIETSRGCPFT